MIADTRKLGRLNVLVVYYAFTFPTRDAILRHCYAIGKYSDYNVFHINLFWEKVPAYLKTVEWDAVVFHNTYLICRPAPELFKRVKEPLQFVRELKCPKIAIAQDEANNTDALCRFIADFGVDVVYSLLATEDARRTAYEGHIPVRVKIRPSLAGYVDDALVKQVADARRRVRARDIDIGYRSFKARARNGPLGVLKWKICDIFKEKAPRYGLNCDLSVDLEDTLNGQDWLNFLARSRYQIGVEGGSSVLDRSGDIMTRCIAYEGDHPEAAYDEIEAACFPGQGESLDGAVISPRVFECAMAGACQILVEGRYNGILEPWVHYIPLRQDFSNIHEILASLNDEERRQRIVDNAYRDLIASERYHYRHFVADIVSQIPERPPAGDARLALLRNRVEDWLNWRLLSLREFLRRRPRLAGFVKFLRSPGRAAWVPRSRPDKV